MNTGHSGSGAAATRIVVLIPALNEELAIRAVVTSALAVCAEVIVVDDGSTDATLERIADLPVQVIRHAVPKGKGESLRAGFREALRRGFDAVVTLDGDGQHDAADIPRLVAAACQYPDHLVIGARLRGREQQPVARRRANAVADWGISWGCGIPVADTQSGQRYYPRRVLELVDLPAQGFVFEAAILIAAVRELGVGVVSVPIDIRYQADARRSHFRPVIDVTRITWYTILRVIHYGHVVASYRRSHGRAPCVTDPPPPRRDSRVNHVPLLLLQLVAILAVARLFALLLQRFGQPPVIGEMLAGIALGPIVFGALAPDWQAWLFAPSSLGALDGLSQLGLILFMFIVGAELRLPQGARRTLTAASLVGVLGVVLPMALGLAISPMLHPRFAPAGVGFWPFALFMAASMAITAFPIMARILKERGMTHTAVGQLSLASAAIADVFAWIVLAFVVALISSGQGWSGFLLTLGGTTVMAAVMFGIVRPLLARSLARHAPDGRPSRALLTALLLGMLASAAATDALGLHAVFGAFLFGAALPRDNRLLETLIERIEHVAVIVMMPVFFALAGLNTTPDAFADTGMTALVLIFAAAVIGKILGGAAGARLGGMPWRESFAVGSLMNARALMELIVIKVGLDAGVIGAEIFTMLMIMAIGTTLMTTPLLIAFTRPEPAAPSADRVPVPRTGA